MPMIASRSSSAPPTPVKRLTGIARSSRHVRGASPIPARLVHPDEIRIQGLAAVVELGLDLRMCQRQVLADARGVAGTGLRADDHGHDLARVVDEATEERSHRVD